MVPFIKQIENFSEEIKNIIDTYLNKDIYEIFKNSIQENIVEKIEKEQVNELMFRKEMTPRKAIGLKEIEDRRYENKKVVNTITTTNIKNMNINNISETGRKFGGSGKKSEETLNFFSNSLDSKLITSNDQIELIKTGINNFDNKTKIKLKLLFRASRYGDNNKSYHEKCDGICPTVSVIKKNWLYFWRLYRLSFSINFWM